MCDSGCDVVGKVAAVRLPSRKHVNILTAARFIMICGKKTVQVQQGVIAYCYQCQLFADSQTHC